MRALDEIDVKKQVEEAKRLADLSPTARFLEEFEAKKKALEEDRALRQQEIEDFEEKKAIEEEVLTKLTNKKVELDERYAKIKMDLEQQITDDLFKQNQKRIESLKKVELQAIRTARALREAGVSST
jgi:hypothetical protein